MSISFGSINTGLPKDIVKQIIAAEKIPIQQMEGRKGKFANKMSLVNELQGLLQDLQKDLSLNPNARAFRELSTSFDDSKIGVTADKNVADPGSHQFEVTQLARKSSAMTSGFEDPDNDYIGVGYISYNMPDGESYEIYVDSEHSSLNGIAQLINKDPKANMTARVVNDGSGGDTPWRLIMSLKDTGDGNTAEFPYFYFIDGDHDFYLEYERPAQDAKVKLDGFEIELSGNQANDLIPGLNIDLRKAAPGEEFTIGVQEDVGKVTEKATLMIDKINAVLKFIIDQNTIDESTDTSQTLGGDVVLQTLESRLRGVIFQSIQTSSGPKRFGDLGVTFQRNGLLKLDPAKFESALGADYENVSEILSGMITEDGIKRDGFIDILTETVDLSLRFPDGIVPNRKRGLQSRIDQIDRRIEQRQRIIEQKENNLKAKFARLESTMSRIRGQSAGLSSLGGGAANVVQQLG